MEFEEGDISGVFGAKSAGGLVDIACDVRVNFETPEKVTSEGVNRRGWFGYDGGSWVLFKLFSQRLFGQCRGLGASSAAKGLLSFR